MPEIPWFVWWPVLEKRIRYRLTAREPSHLCQFSEYDVLLDGEKIGEVCGSADIRHSPRLGRQVVTDRTWSATTLDGRGAGVGNATRREVTRDLLRTLGLDQNHPAVTESQ